MEEARTTSKRWIPYCKETRDKEITIRGVSGGLGQYNKKLLLQQSTGELIITITHLRNNCD